MKMDTKHKICFLFFLMGGYIVAGDNAYIPSTCESPGMKCDSTLQNVGLCTKGSQTWRELVRCQSSSCVCEGGLCSCREKNISHHPRSLLNISCLKRGIYPDPENCRNSIYCEPGQPVNPCNKCSEGQYYNACTGNCESGSCSTQPTCKKPAVKERVNGNPKLYRMCIGNRMIMDFCPSLSFDQNSLKCESSDDAECHTPKQNSTECGQPSTTTDTSSTTTSTTLSHTTTNDSSTSIITALTTSPNIPTMSTVRTTTQPSTSTSSAPVICRGIGPVKDPNDCHWFYFCDIKLYSYHLECNPGYGYDDTKKACTLDITC